MDSRKLSTEDLMKIPAVCQQRMREIGIMFPDRTVRCIQNIKYLQSRWNNIKNIYISIISVYISQLQSGSFQEIISSNLHTTHCLPPAILLEYNRRKMEKKIPVDSEDLIRFGLNGVSVNIVSYIYKFFLWARLRPKPFNIY